MTVSKIAKALSLTPLAVAEEAIKPSDRGEERLEGVFYLVFIIA